MRNKALGGKGGKDLNRKYFWEGKGGKGSKQGKGEKILGRKKEKILGGEGERISTGGKDLGEEKGEDLRGEKP